ncbi:MAG: FapA family protein, partial [Thermoanaerobacterium sp.]|nr:FapA family protein [Thermoanaerobacterium sp.]
MCDLKYSCRLEISSDEMSAFLIVENISNDGITLNKDNIYDLLRSHNIVFGIIDNAIDKICKSPNVNERYLIAQGKKPINGKDGRVEYLIDFESNAEPKVLDDGRVDYKELQIFKSVKKDEIIARK